MTLPRAITPETTYLVTRRCTQRSFFLKPSCLLRHILAFLLARYAALFGIEIHCFSFLSNHYHIVLTDRLGCLPAFTQAFNSMVGRCGNHMLKHWENFWASGQISQVRLARPEDILDKMIYVFTNPVRSGLVDASARWLGLQSRPKHFRRKPIRCTRPDFYSRRRTVLPPQAYLVLTVPPGFEEYSPEEFAQLLEERINAEEKRLREQARAEGKSFLGRARLRKIRPEDHPSTQAPRRNLSPQIACHDPELRVSLLAALKEFVRAYYEALEQYVAGKLDTFFPYGTYWMRVHLAVPCAPAPPTPAPP